MERRTIACYLFILFVGVMMAQEFSPQVTVTKCMDNELILNVVGASDNGILYIQDRDSGCRKNTTTTGSYVFGFKECRLKWKESFTIVIQKRPHVETGNDYYLNVTCLADPSVTSLEVKNGVNISGVPDDDKIAYLNKTTKPEAYITIVNKERKPVTGHIVHLGDLLTMTIALDDEFKAELDINVLRCTAASMSIIEDGCAVDEEIFPTFEKTERGEQRVDFAAFRPTNQMKGPVIVEYQCELMVCYNKCSTINCTNIRSTSGRRRRDAAIGSRRRRAVKEDRQDFENISVHAKVILADGTPPDDNTEEACIAGDWCIRKTTSYIVIGCVAAVVVISAIVVAIVAKFRRSDQPTVHRCDFETPTPISISPIRY